MKFKENKFIKNKYIWTIIFAIMLTSFTLYVVLDTFVITRVYTVVQPDKPSETVSESSETVSEPTNEQQTQISTAEPEPKQDDTSQFTETAVLTENSYSDQNISITITEYREDDTTIYVADVYVSSAEYLQTAFAQSSFGSNITEKTSAIAQNNDAILAINGDYYGSQKKGYVLKNAVIYRETSASDQEDLVILEDGSFEIITEGEVTAAELLKTGAVQVLSFGPELVINGSVSVSESEEVGKAKASNPRTAIGIVDDLHYLFVVSDGRTDESAGLTLYQLAEFMQGLGANIAYNLDGGGSSTMYFNGEVINNPTSSGNTIKERSVSDIVYIGY